MKTIISKVILLALLCLLSVDCGMAKDYHVASPNKNLTLTIETDKRTIT